MQTRPFGFLDTHLSLSRTSHADEGEAPGSVITPSKQTGGHQVSQHNEWIGSKHLESQRVLLILHSNNPQPVSWQFLPPHLSETTEQQNLGGYL